MAEQKLLLDEKNHFKNIMARHKIWLDINNGLPINRVGNLFWKKIFLKFSWSFETLFFYFSLL